MHCGIEKISKYIVEKQVLTVRERKRQYGMWEEEEGKTCGVGFELEIPK